MLYWWRSRFWRGFMLLSLLVVIFVTIIAQIIAYTSEAFKLVQKETPEILKRENKLSKTQAYSVFYISGGNISDNLYSTDNLYSYETMITDYRHCFYYLVNAIHKDGKWSIAYIYLSGDNGRYDQVYPHVPDSLAWGGHQRP